MKTADLTAWIQAGANVLLLIITFIYTRLSVRTLQSQTKPFVIVGVEAERDAPDAPVVIFCRNIGNGPTVDISGQLVLRPWETGTRSSPVSIDFSRTFLDADDNFEIRLPPGPTGERLKVHEFYAMFESFYYSLVYLNNIGEKQRQRGVML